MTLEPGLAEHLLHEGRMAYLLADHDLRVVAGGGDFRLLGPNGAVRPGARVTDLLPELAGDLGSVRDVLSGTTSRHELVLLNRESSDGATTYLDLAVLPWRDGSDRTIGITLLVQDATGSGRREQHIRQQHNELVMLRDRLARQNLELRAANVELGRLDEMKSLFVSVAAHELRSPLASISAYLELLMDGGLGRLTDPQRNALAVVRSSADRLLAITNNLLDATRIESGHLELDLQPIGLADLLERSVAEFRARFESHTQALVLSRETGLPPALCDAKRVAQVVGNLLDNAQKYSPDGTRVTVRLGRAAEPGFLRVSVADEGVGIDPEDRPRLFTRFFRTGRATESEAGGTGLGLFICRSLVESQGGRIGFDSVPGRGSTFWFTVPVDAPGAAND